MLPIVTPEEMAEVDRRALESEPLEAILERVGAALAREAIAMMGGTYGRRVVAVSGPGLNGADARACAALLRDRGVHVIEIDALEAAPLLPACDLVIDGAFGTGLTREYRAPTTIAPVLSVDIPSGIDGLLGAPLGTPVHADRTLTMTALKPGLLFGAGPEYAGDVTIADIGLDASSASAHLVEDRDVVEWLPPTPRSAHKWHTAVLVVAGSPGMTGAAHLASRGAMRAGAGYVHLDSAVTSDPQIPVEVVGSLGGLGVKTDPSRFRAGVIGPGLGRSASAGQLVRAALGALDAPAVVDGDGLNALISSPEVTIDRTAPSVLTPHDGEFQRLTGAPVPADRMAGARRLAAARGCVVLLKGPATVIAEPGGRTLVANAGDARLATAGSGDVLSGIIGAFLARGVPAFEAAAAAAHVHGAAATAGHRVGLIASDLPDLVAAWLSTR
ncbi:MAG: NAD(P)H-hydrate dehydratase [Acidimicrobiales bacterium]